MNNFTKYLVSREKLALAVLGEEYPGSPLSGTQVVLSLRLQILFSCLLSLEAPFVNSPKALAHLPTKDSLKPILQAIHSMK